MEASVRVPALVWLMVRVQAKHSSTWPPDSKLPRITKWLSLTKAAIKGHHPGDATQEAVLQPKPLINAMTPSSLRAAWLTQDNILASCHDATSPTGTKASNIMEPTGLFLSGLLIHVITWMFFRQKQVGSQESYHQALRRSTPMPRNVASVRRSFFFKEWHPTIGRHQPFNLLRSSENTILCNSVLNSLIPQNSPSEMMSPQMILIILLP